MMSAISRILLWIARLILVGNIAFAAWSFGGIQTKTQPWLCVGVFVAGVFWLLSLILNRASSQKNGISFSWSWSIVPLVLGMLLGLLQVLPGSGKIVGSRTVGRTALSLPAQTENNEQITSPDCVPSRVKVSTSFISLFPASTRTVLAQLVLAVVVFLMGMGLFGREYEQQTLWWLLAINGAALSLFGIVQRMSYDGRLFWKYRISGNAQPFASFVNRNNAAGFLNLSLAACLGALLWSLYRHDFKSTHQSALKGKKVGWLRKWGGEARMLIASLDGYILAALILTTCTAAGLLLSVSRGGILAAGFAGMVLFFILIKQKYHKLILLLSTVVFIGGFFLISSIGLKDTVQARLDTLNVKEVQADARLRNWSETSYAITDFPLFGTGLGTYRYSHIPYQQIPNEGWFYHAENQYFQTVIEAGAIGILLLLAVLFTVAWDIKTLTSWRGLRIQDGLPIVAGFAFLTQVAHSFVDFGLYLPANMMLFALLMGSMSAKACKIKRTTNQKQLAVKEVKETPSAANNIESHSKKGRLASVILVALFCLFLSGISWYQLEARSHAGYEIAREQEIKNYSDANEKALGEINTKIALFKKGLALRPADAIAHLSIAQLYLNRYRVLMWRKVPSKSEHKKTNMLLRKWKATHLLRVHDSILALKATGSKQAFTDFRNSPECQNNLLPAYEHLQAARKACPILSTAYLLEAALAPLYEKQTGQSVALIQIAVALNPSDVITQEHAGQLAFQLDENQLALCCWQKAMQLEPNSQEEIINTALLRWPAKMVVHRLLPNDPEVLVDLAKGWGNRSLAKGQIRSLVLTRAEKLLTELEKSDVEEGEGLNSNLFYLQAECAKIRGKNEVAIEKLKKALHHRPLNSKWHAELARILFEEGRKDEALKSARDALDLSPQTVSYQRLISKIIRSSLNPKN